MYTGRRMLVDGKELNRMLLVRIEDGLNSAERPIDRKAWESLRCVVTIHKPWDSTTKVYQSKLEWDSKAWFCGGNHPSIISYPCEEIQYVDEIINGSTRKYTYIR